jgi:hypothetical protein
VKRSTRPLAVRPAGLAVVFRGHDAGQQPLREGLALPDARTLRDMLRTVTATRYVTPLREGGSLPAVVEADDDGLYVLKFKAAGQGPKALVAEVVAGEIARHLGLPVPEIVTVDLDPALARAEPDHEIRDLLGRSGGLNAGLDFLPGALPYRPRVEAPPDAHLAADIVWFDALVTNVDRTPRNPNLLVWHGRHWLIDHGAALYVQHTWREPRAHARRGFSQAAEHVLLPVAGSLAEADSRLAPRIDRPVLESILALVPDEWLSEPRDDYVSYLLARLEAPRPFVAEVERARRAA